MKWQHRRPEEGKDRGDLSPEGHMVELSGEQKKLFDRWVTLTGKQKIILLDLIENMK